MSTATYNPHYQPPAPQNPKEKIQRLNRDQIVHLLEEGCGCQCYDHETKEQLAEDLLANVEDGTLCETTLDAALEE